MIQSQRKWKLIKQAIGPLSLYLDWRLRKPKPRRPLDIYLIDALMGRLITKPELAPFSKTERQRYLDATSKTIYWHGTGRLQYDKRGKVVDVLEQLLKQGAIKPFRDVFDVKRGEMFSISVARQRMYARIYGDMHEYKGAKPQLRYGTPRFWTYYFIMAINLHAIKELGLWKRSVRHEQQKTWRDQGTKVWTVKVTKNGGSSVGKFFDEGSDIAGNYPILVGLKDFDYTLLETADYVARYESRIGSAIPIQAFTHLEVPANKQTEVEALLKKYGHGDVPVFPFEQSERLYAGKHFSELVFQPK